MTTTDVTTQYPPRMRRGQVIELGRKLGLSDYAVRKLIEGEAAPVRGIVYPGTQKQYFDRADVVQSLFTLAES